MAILTAGYSTNQTNTELVAATSGKLIRILRVLASFESAGTLKLISSPGQADAADVTPLIYMASAGLLHLDLPREQALTTARGRALGFTSSIASAGKGQGIMIWYELVD